MNRKNVASKEAWPAVSIDRYSRIEDGDWGYLIFYSDNSFEFDSTARPTNEEIMTRWGRRFAEGKVLKATPEVEASNHD